MGCLTDFEGDLLQPRQPAALKLGMHGLRRRQRLLKGLARFFGTLQASQHIPQFGLRLHRAGRECNRGLRFRERVLEMIRFAPPTVPV